MGSLAATKLCGALVRPGGTVFNDGAVYDCEGIGTHALRRVAELLERCAAGTAVLPAEACASFSATGTLDEALAVLHAADFLSAADNVMLACKRNLCRAGAR